MIHRPSSAAVSAVVTRAAREARLVVRLLALVSERSAREHPTLNTRAPTKSEVHLRHGVVTAGNPTVRGTEIMPAFELLCCDLRHSEAHLSPRVPDFVLGLQVK